MNKFLSDRPTINHRIATNEVDLLTMASVETANTVGMTTKLSSLAGMSRIAAPKAKRKKNMPNRLTSIHNEG
jgi:hypothetical protein